MGGFAVGIDVLEMEARVLAAEMAFCRKRTLYIYVFSL